MRSLCRSRAGLACYRGGCLRIHDWLPVMLQLQLLRQWQQYFPRTVANSVATQHALQAEGIQTGLHYPIPVHLQEAHADLGHTLGDFPQSEAAARTVLSLPMFPEMSSTQVEQVVGAVRQEANVV